MAGTQYDVIVGMQLQGSTVARQAAQQVDAILQEYGRLNRANISGPLSQQSIDQFAGRLRQALSQAFNGSEGFRALRDIDRQAVRAAGSGSSGSTPLLQQQLRLAQAELAAEQVRQRSRIPIGQTANGVSGYATEGARSQARLSAAGGIERANAALENAILKQIREMDRATARQERSDSQRLQQYDRAVQRNARAESDRERALAREIAAILRRTAAEERAERALGSQQAQAGRLNDRFDAARAGDQALAGRTPAYSNPNGATRLGRAQGAVNAADVALERANLLLADERQREGRTEASLLAAQARLERATIAATAARERVAEESRRAAPNLGGAAAGGGGFGANFAAGFRGASDRPYAEQLGQAFKFSVFYGTAYKLLSGITATFQQTLQEGIEFQTALSELVLATGQSGEAAEQLASNLGDRATQAGFAPSEGVLAGARGLGLYGATQVENVSGGAAEQARIADISARVATRVAFNSGMQTQDVQTNIAAITNAFGTGAEGQFRVADLDAYFSRRFGTVPGGTIQAVAESANVGQAAGFNQEEINAIAALLQGRTGQTASTVAGYMAQIFSRGGEGSLAAVGQRYGIDPTLTLADQIKELSRVYKEGTPNEQNAIASSFGRGKVQNAVTVLLGGFGEVEQAASDVRAGAADNASDNAFNVRLGNIGGQIQLTTATLKEFANQLGQTGVLDVLGGAVLVLREIADAGSGVLKLFNDLPGPLRALAIAALAAAAAQRLGAGGALAGGALGIYRGAPLGVAANGAIAGRLAIGAGANAVPLASRAGLAAAGGGLLTTLVNPVTAAVGGLVAIGAFKNKADALNEAMGNAAESLDQGLGAGATSDQLTARASALRGSANDTRQESSGVLASLLNIGNRIGGGQSDADRARQLADQLDSEAKRLDALGESTKREEAFNAPKQTLIDGFDEDSLKTAMDRINQSGGSAADRLDALADSIAGSGDAAQRAANSFDPNLFAGTNAAGIFEAIQGSGNVGVSTPGFGGIAKNLITGLTPLSPFGQQGQGDRKYENVLPDLVRQSLSQGDVAKRLQDSLAGITDLSTLSPEQITAIATSVIGDTANQVGASQGLDDSAIDDLQGYMLDAVTKYLTEQVSAVSDIISGKTTFTGPELTAIINQTVADLSDALGSLQQTDYGTRLSTLRQAVSTIKGAIARAPGGAGSGDAEQLASLERQVAQAEFDRLEALRKRAQQNAGSKSEVAAIGRRYLRREIAAAVRGGNADLLVQIVGQAGEGAIAIARQAINDAIQVARAANRLRAQALGAAANIDGAGFARGGNIDTSKLPAGGQDITGLKKLKNSLNAATTSGGGTGNVYETGSDVPGYSADAAGSGETAADRRVAAAQAAALRSESPIQQARADILAARTAMSQAKKGTVEYYNALGQLYQAQQSLTDAILQYRSNQYLLGIDMTDPLAQAQVALRVARDKLRSDRGKGADVVAEDKVAVRNAQAEAEQTAFQQRLDQVQTADDLGRISHQKYLAYLQHEHDRLDGIKNRTFQQQSQLDTIDKLMQEAATSMNSQWNFGDIKLPTPYQVRRRLEELSPQAMAGNSDLLTNPVRSMQGDVINNFDINGADTGAVLSILREALGQAPRRGSNGRSRNK